MDFEKFNLIELIENYAECLEIEKEDGEHSTGEFLEKADYIKIIEDLFFENDEFDEIFINYLFETIKNRLKAKGVEFYE